MLVDVVCLVEAVVGEAVFDPAKKIISIERTEKLDLIEIDMVVRRFAFLSSLSWWQ